MHVAPYLLPLEHEHGGDDVVHALGVPRAGVEAHVPGERGRRRGEEGVGRRRKRRMWFPMLDLASLVVLKFVSLSYSYAHNPHYTVDDSVCLCLCLCWCLYGSSLCALCPLFGLSMVLSLCCIPHHSPPTYSHSTRCAVPRKAAMSAVSKSCRIPSSSKESTWGRSDTGSVHA